MVIVELNGGLGNQMFQYAAGRSLAAHLGVPLKMDTYTLLDRSNPDKTFIFREYDLSIWQLTHESFASNQDYYAVVGESRVALSLWEKVQRKWRKNVLGIDYAARVYNEPHFHFDTTFFDKKTPIYLKGYWQSVKYFAPIVTELRKEFTFKTTLPTNCLALAAKIQSTQSICLNVRRGDFINNQAASTVLGFAGLDYLYQSVNYIIERVSSPEIFIFSDDLDWCRANIQLPFPITFVTEEYAGEKYEHKLQLMAMCKYFAIPNSTYSWWAAWLATYPEKIVVVPRRWFAKEGMSTDDMHPADWVRL